MATVLALPSHADMADQRQRWVGRCLTRLPVAESFYAGVCPEARDLERCTKRGDYTGTYHYQAWINDFACPVCQTDRLEHAVGVVLNDKAGIRGLLCPACRTVLDVYISIRATELERQAYRVRRERRKARAEAS